MARGQISPPQQQTLQILWAGMLGSVVVYGVVVAIMMQQGSVGEGTLGETELWTMTGVFAAVSLSMIGATIFADKIFPVGDYVTFCILRWALLEAVGVFGLVLFFLGAPVVVWAAFMGVGFLAIAMHYPGDTDARRFLEAAAKR